MEHYLNNQIHVFPCHKNTFQLQYHKVQHHYNFQDRSILKNKSFRMYKTINCFSERDSTDQNSLILYFQYYKCMFLSRNHIDHCHYMGSHYQDIIYLKDITFFIQSGLLEVSYLSPMFFWLHLQFNKWRLKRFWSSNCKT